VRALDVLAVLALSACVPGDQALPLGSVQFAIGASPRTTGGVESADGYALHFDRVLLGFKTMTIGQVNVPDKCAYRGRGAASDVVFDPRIGIVQTFNGIEPTNCPDVGVIFGAPGGGTTPAGGASSDELIELAAGVPAHAIVEATATKRSDAGSMVALGFGPGGLRIKLRLRSDRTATRFGGCREAAPGVLVLGSQRLQVPVSFAAEALFQDTLLSNASEEHLRVHPFLQADQAGDNDGIVTMDELDALPLSLVTDSDTYALPSNSSQGGSFGDFVRELFRFTVHFREQGFCSGNEPGAAEN
jgi:hypothetical protein